MEKKGRNKPARILTGRNVMWAVVSLFLALIIWVYYGSNYGTEVTRSFYGVAVTYSGEEAMRDSLNLIISREEVTSVNVTLTGSRKDLSGLTSADLTAVVNLSTVTTAGYRTMGYTLSYPSSVNSANIEIESQTPQTIGLQISKLSTKSVPVDGRFDGTLTEGYVLDSAGMVFDPAYVQVIGPEEELAQIDCAYVVVDRDDVSSSFTATANFNLTDENGQTLAYDDLTVDVDTVLVTVPVDMTKEVALDVLLLDGGGATSDNVVKEIEPSSITLAGEASTLESINTIYLDSVDLSEYLSFPETEYAITLPNDTESLSGESSATVNLSFTGLESRLYSVTNLEYINLEEGYTADIIEPTLVVTIRAPEDTLALLESNSIRAVADLTGVTTTAKVPVTIYVDGYEDAGAVGDYTVYVRMTPEE